MIQSIPSGKAFFCFLYFLNITMFHIDQPTTAVDQQPTDL